MVPRAGQFRHPADVRVERLDVSNVLAAEGREPGAQLVVVADTVRREAVPKLARETAAAGVPVREDDRLAMVAGNEFADREEGRASVQRDDVPADPEGPEGAPVALPLDEDRRMAVLVDEVLEDSRQVVVEALVVYDGPTAEIRSSAALRSSPETAIRFSLDPAPQTIVTSAEGTPKRSAKNRTISRFASPDRAGAATRRRRAWRQGSTPRISVREALVVTTRSRRMEPAESRRARSSMSAIRMASGPHKGCDRTRGADAII